MLKKAFAIVSMTLAASYAMAADGTVTFNGSVTSTTCSVNVAGSGAANATVVLPTVSTSSLSGGATAGAKAFSIVIGGPGQTGCTDGLTAGINFEAGPNVDIGSGTLKNTGSASNVNVVLMNTDGSMINVGNTIDNNKGAAVIAGNTATLNYIAAYKAIGGAAGQGSVAATVDYSVTYN